MRVCTTVEIDKADAEHLDVLGAMAADVKAAKVYVKDYEDAISALVSKYEANADPTVGLTLQGENFALDLGEKGKSRTLTDLNRLIEIIGAETFLSICKVGITDIVKYVPDHQLPEVLTTTQTGARSKSIRSRA